MSHFCRKTEQLDILNKPPLIISILPKVSGLPFFRYLCYLTMFFSSNRHAKLNRHEQQHNSATHYCAICHTDSVTLTWLSGMYAATQAFLLFITNDNQSESDHQHYYNNESSIWGVLQNTLSGSSLQKGKWGNFRWCANTTPTVLFLPHTDSVGSVLEGAGRDPVVKLTMASSLLRALSLLDTAFTFNTYSVEKVSSFKDKLKLFVEKVLIGSC